MTPIYPILPIITPDPPPPPRKTQAEKYGGLLYAGIGGLVVTLGLLAYFGLGVGGLRPTLRAIYRLHDARLPTAGRIEAAYALRHDPKFTPRQAYDIAVGGRTLPPLARYLVAESLTAEAARGDPRAYALAVERSTGWPDWFRLLILRPLAYAAGEGVEFPPEPLEALANNPDPTLALWARYALSVDAKDAASRAAIEAEAGGTGPGRELAGLLIEAMEGRGEARVAALDRATLWVRAKSSGGGRGLERLGRSRRPSRPRPGPGLAAERG